MKRTAFEALLFRRSAFLVALCRRPATRWDCAVWADLNDQLMRRLQSTGSPARR